MAGWAQQNAIAASTVERHVRFTKSIPQSAEGILHEMHRHRFVEHGCGHTANVLEKNPPLSTENRIHSAFPDRAIDSRGEGPLCKVREGPLPPANRCT